MSYWQIIWLNCIFVKSRTLAHAIICCALGNSIITWNNCINWLKKNVTAYFCFNVMQILSETHWQNGFMSQFLLAKCHSSTGYNYHFSPLILKLCHLRHKENIHSSSDDIWELFDRLCTLVLNYSTDGIAMYNCINILLVNISLLKEEVNILY